MRTIKNWFAGSHQGLYRALVLSNLFSLVLFAARAINAGNMRYWFMVWNLALSVLPLIFARWLTLSLKKEVWSAPINLFLTFLWLGFLPNSFYTASDLIHLHSTGEVSLLYDAAMFFSFIFNAYVLGFMSVYLVHRELIKHIKSNDAHKLIAAVFLVCGFAIYLGRYLRWNTWDLIVSPAGLLFDLSERVINPSDYPQSFTTTVVFSLLLSVMYYVIWNLVETIASTAKLKKGKRESES